MKVGDKVRVGNYRGKTVNRWMNGSTGVITSVIFEDAVVNVKLDRKYDWEKNDNMNYILPVSKLTVIEESKEHSNG